MRVPGSCLFIWTSSCIIATLFATVLLARFLRLFLLLLASLGVLLGYFWAALGRSWPLLVALGALLSAFGPLLGRSWDALGASWAPLGRLLGALGRLLDASWAYLGRSWVSLGRFWASWAPLGRILGASWAIWGSILKGFKDGLGGFGVRSGPQNNMQPGHQCLQRAQFSSHLSFLTSSRQVASAGCAKRKQCAGVPPPAC